MVRDSLLHRLAVVAHLGLAIAVAFTLGTLDLAPVWRRTIGVAAAVPLGAGLPGLVARRRAPLPWLAVAVVG